MKEDWNILSLGDCFEYIRNGANIKQEKGAGGIPITRIETLAGGVFNRDRLGYADIKSSEKYASYILESGDLLFSHINSKAYIGRTVLYEKEGGEIIIHGMNLLRMKVIPDVVIPKFIFYSFKSQYFREQVASYRKDAVNQSSISVGDLKKIQIAVPSISTQRRIVAELDLLSGIIEKKNAQLRTLDELANTIFYEMFGNPDDSPYDIKPLSKLSPFKLAYGSGASAVDYNGLVRYIRITDIEEGGTLTNAPMSPDTFDEKYLLNDGDILFARSGATVGKTYLYKKTEGKAIFAGYLIRFIPDERIVLPEYIYYFTRSQYYRSFVRLNAQAVAQPNINAQQYGGLKVSVPPMPLQKLFAKKIASINCQKEIIMLSVKSAQQLLESRMNSYFSI